MTFNRFMESDGQEAGLKGFGQKGKPVYKGE